MEFATDDEEHHADIKRNEGDRFDVRGIGPRGYPVDSLRSTHDSKAADPTKKPRKKPMPYVNHNRWKQEGKLVDHPDYQYGRAVATGFTEADAPYGEGTDAIGLTPAADPGPVEGYRLGVAAEGTKNNRIVLVPPGMDPDAKKDRGPRHCSRMDDPDRHFTHNGMRFSRKSYWRRCMTKRTMKCVQYVKALGGWIAVTEEDILCNVFADHVEAMKALTDHILSPGSIWEFRKKREEAK